MTIHISSFLFYLLQAVRIVLLREECKFPQLLIFSFFLETATHRPLPYWLLASYQIHSASNPWCILAELWRILISKPHPQNFEIRISVDWVKAFMLAQNSIRFHFTIAWFRATHQTYTISHHSFYFLLLVQCGRLSTGSKAFLVFLCYSHINNWPSQLDCLKQWLSCILV